MNMEIWDKVRQPPRDALKTITGGRLRGMTDINPQWRYEVLTEIFGPCGVGWKYEVEKLWLEPGSDEQITAFAKVNFYYRTENIEAAGFVKQWSDPIPGIGGSLFIAKEQSGLRTSDEAYKMAVTDALSVALKMLGVAADIYAGKFDGSKYKNGDNPQTGKDTPRPTENTITNKPVTHGDQATEKQVAALYKIAAKNDLTNKELDQLANWYKTGKRVSKKEASEMIKDFKGILDRYLDYRQEVGS